MVSNLAVVDVKGILVLTVVASTLEVCGAVDAASLALLDVMDAGTVVLLCVVLDAVNVDEVTIVVKSELVDHNDVESAVVASVVVVSEMVVVFSASVVVSKVVVKLVVSAAVVVVVVVVVLGNAVFGSKHSNIYEQLC